MTVIKINNYAVEKLKFSLRCATLPSGTVISNRAPFPCSPVSRIVMQVILRISQESAKPNLVFSQIHFTQVQAHPPARRRFVPSQCLQQCDMKRSARFSVA